MEDDPTSKQATHSTETSCSPDGTLSATPPTIAPIPPTPTSQAAATVSVAHVLALLDGSFAGMAKGIAAGEYAFWLGSGISRERVDDLTAFIRRVLNHLNSRIGLTVPEYEQALTEAVDLAELEPAQRAAIDVRQPVSSWPYLAALLKRLGEKYSLFLDIRVGNNAPDYLLWEAGAAATTFGVPNDPDVEHLCLAVLAIEGVAPEMASGNWDSLIEAGLTELGAGNVVAVCVRADDLRNPRQRARLIKFHGCAASALKDPTQYRELLIARQSQITDWQSSSKQSPIRTSVEQLAGDMRTLMIGLSAQDANIQNIFGTAKNRMQWPWPCSPPAHVFAEDRLGPLQKGILKCAYGAGYDKDPSGAEANALFRAFAKPLLISLVLNVLCAKMQTYSALYLRSYSQSDRDELAAGMRFLRDAAAATNPHDATFVRRLAATVTRAMALLQEGNGQPGSTYRPLGTVPVPRIHTEPHVLTSGLREAATAIGLLGDGNASGNWSVVPGDTTRLDDGALRILSPGRQTKVFFIANGTAEIALFRDGIVDSNTSDVVLVHASARAHRSARSPKGPLGRTEKAQVRHVEMPTLVAGATTLAELRVQFRQEACL
jgi:hypothetical protein